jgi:hypothetical protein
MPVPKKKSPKRRKRDFKFLSRAATRLSFTGAMVQGRRLIPDTGFTFEATPDKKVVLLKKRRGRDIAAIECECGLEGGNCRPAILDSGEIGEYLACIPDSGCGTSGLFCFLRLEFPSGLILRFQM